MFKGSLSLCLFVLLLVNVHQVSAQETTPLVSDGSESKLIKRKSIVIVRKRTEQAETKGIELENYVFLPSIVVTEYYDNNLFAADSNEQSDWITVITPTFDLKSNWKQHEFNVDAGFEAVRHSDWASENTDNAWLNLNGQYDTSKNGRLFAGYSYMRDHEDRGSVDAEAGDEPTEFDDISVDLGYSGNQGRHYFKVASNSRRLDFDDVGSPLGTIDYDDRDRDEDLIGLRYLFKYSATTAFFVDTVSDRRDYRQTPDNAGNDRNSDGFSYAVGFERVSPGTVGRAFVGRLERDYESTDFDDADETDLGLQLRWKISPETSLVARSSRSIGETTLDNSPGYLLDNLLLRLNVALSEEKALSFGLIGSTADYYAIDREDDYLDMGVEYSQQLFSNLKFEVELHRAERESNVDGEDYNIDQIFFRINAAI